MGAGRAATTVAPAAVERPVAGNAVVVTGDSASILAALIGRRALAPKSDRAAAATTAAADAVDAKESAAAIRILGARSSVVAAAIERAIRVDAVRGTDGRTTGLTALA
jgi:hypothetical protein